MRISRHASCHYLSGRTDATEAGPSGLVPKEGATADEYIAWFQRMRLSIPALVNLCPYVDATCEATLRAEPSLDMLFAEIDGKRYAPGYAEKPLIKNLREVTLRGPAEVADETKYVRVEANGDAVAAIPQINGQTMKSVKQLMDNYTDPYPVWIM